jgi:hypothetical protein
MVYGAFFLQSEQMSSIATMQGSASEAGIGRRHRIDQQTRHYATELVIN